MNKKFYIPIALLIIILLTIFYTSLKNNDETIILNEFYDNNLETKEDIVPAIIVHITGCVQNPGIVSVPANSRIIDVISSAGGTTIDADLSKINLAYIVSDAQKIYIPSINDNLDESNYISNSPGENVIEGKGTSSAININTASQAELETLPGVGPSTALKIINYREKNGKFKNIEDIMNVPGIGQSKFNSLKDYICIK